MSSKLPIKLENLLRQRQVEGERIEYKRGWNPDPILRTLCAFANDFKTWEVVMWLLVRIVTIKGSLCFLLRGLWRVTWIQFRKSCWDSAI